EPRWGADQSGAARCEQRGGGEHHRRRQSAEHCEQTPGLLTAAPTLVAAAPPSCTRVTCLMSSQRLGGLFPRQRGHASVDRYEERRPPWTASMSWCWVPDLPVRMPPAAWPATVCRSQSSSRSSWVANALTGAASRRRRCCAR